MNNEVIRLIIEIVGFAAVAVLCYFMPNISSKVMDKNAILTYLASWAYKLVVAAKNQMVGKTGTEKFNYVATEIQKICEAQVFEVVKLDQLTTQNQTQDEKLNKAFKEIDEVKSTVKETAKSVDEVKDLIFINERDRLRGELFNCGNRCRRGIPLMLEEFRYIQEVYKKYNSVLKCNSIGTDEYNFICAYFHSKENQEKIK
ncbi:MAG: hypothetical protein IKE65_02960 [Clostridia bacterium]|nr:hypothetical protein [Clostridia bacterium]